MIGLAHVVTSINSFAVFVVVHSTPRPIDPNLKRSLLADPKDTLDRLDNLLVINFETVGE